MHGSYHEGKVGKSSVELPVYSSHICQSDDYNIDYDNFNFDESFNSDRIEMVFGSFLHTACMWGNFTDTPQ